MGHAVSASDLIECLAVPYVVVMYAVEKDGEWQRRAECPELPGCSVVAPTALQAMDELESLRVRIIVDMHHRGEQPPRPRPPLKSGLAMLGPLDVDEFLASVFNESIE
jgi:predicted RNase H-like HicB family nuclease